MKGARRILLIFYLSTVIAFALPAYMGYSDLWSCYQSVLAGTANLCADPSAVGSMALWIRNIWLLMLIVTAVLFLALLYQFAAPLAELVDEIEHSAAGPLNEEARTRLLDKVEKLRKILKGT